MGKYYNRMLKYLGKRITVFLTAGTVRRLNKERKKFKRKKFAVKSFHIAVDGIICLNRKINYIKL